MRSELSQRCLTHDHVIRALNTVKVELGAHLKRGGLENVASPDFGFGLLTLSSDKWSRSRIYSSVGGSLDFCFNS